MVVSEVPHLILLSQGREGEDLLIHIIELDEARPLETLTREEGDTQLGTTGGDSTGKTTNTHDTAYEERWS